MGQLNKNKIENGLIAECADEGKFVNIKEFLEQNLRLTRNCDDNCSISKCLLSQSPDYLCHVSGLKVVEMQNHVNQYRIKPATVGEIINFKDKYGII